MGSERCDRSAGPAIDADVLATAALVPARPRGAADRHCLRVRQHRRSLTWPDSIVPALWCQASLLFTDKLQYRVALKAPVLAKPAVLVRKAIVVASNAV